MPGRAGGVDERRREGLHPAVDRHVIDCDAALGEQLLDVAIGQGEAQVPAHRHRDHIAREAVASRRGRRSGTKPDHLDSLSTASPDQRNSARDNIAGPG
jgi:hypothetical protein